MNRPWRSCLVLVSVIALAATACGKSTPKPSVGATGPFGATKDATIAAEVPSDIRAKGTLQVPMDASYPPDEFFAPDNKTIIGLDIDLGNALAAVLGLKFNFVNATGAFATIIPGLQSGKYDLSMSSFTDNKDREKVVDFVDYLSVGASIFVASSNSKSYTSLAQLCGLSVAAERGTFEADDIDTQSKKCRNEGKKAINKLEFPDQDKTNLAVVDGRAEAALADTQVCEYAVKQTGGKVKITGEYVAPAPYGIAIPRPKGAALGSGPLVKPIFDALKKLMDTGIYKQILDKYGIGDAGLSAPTINKAVG